jgi:uncharacterized protein
MATRTKQSRADGLVNVVTGLGMPGRDKSAANVFAWCPTLGPGQLDDIYRGSGIGRRVVDLPVLEMTREWFKIEGDPDDAVLGHLETMKARTSIREALRWGNLYGGALIVMGLDDGVADLAEPVNTDTLRQVAFMTVYDRHQVSWTSADLYQDQTDRRYNTPQWYTIRPYYQAGAAGLEQLRVHESRTLRFCGAALPPQQRRANNGWDDSVLQAPYAELRNLVAGHQHSANLIEEWAVGVIVIKNLINLLAAKGGEDKVRQRLEIIDYCKSVLHSVLLAEGESFEKKTASIAGLPEVLDRFAQALSSSCGIPVSLLFGEPPSGLQATGEYLQDNWYDQVKAWQEEKLQPALETLVRYEFLSKQGPTRGAEPANWKIVFNPLKQNDEKEDAGIRKTQAEVDVMYINAGVLTPEEVAMSRFGGDRYTTDTTIDPQLHQQPTEQELAAEEAAAAARDAALLQAQQAQGQQQPPAAGNGAAT